MFVVSLSNKAYAQEKNNELKEFHSSITQSIISSTGRVSKECTSIAFILKIEIGIYGKIDRITASDSLDSLYRNNFNEELELINNTSLLKFSKVNNAFSSILLMPVYIIYGGAGSREFNFNPVLLNKLSVFNGNSFTGKCVWLDPLSLKAKSNYKQ